jgi:hypothetical protein
MRHLDEVILGIAILVAALLAVVVLAAVLTRLADLLAG